MIGCFFHVYCPETWTETAGATTETTVRGTASGTLVDSGSREGSGSLYSGVVVETGLSLER